MSNQWLVIKQLNQQLKEWQTVNNKYGRPRVGWVKAVRVALCMSVEQLAERLGLTRARITQIENAEVHDAVTLRTLREVANAMECELVYAIVPKGENSLDDIIQARAEQIANERVSRVAHSMSLEAQSVKSASIKVQKESLAKSLAEELGRKFWSSSDNKFKQTELSKKLMEQLQKKK